MKESSNGRVLTLKSEKKQNRALVVVPEGLFGGAQRQARLLAEGIAERKKEVFLLELGGKKPRLYGVLVASSEPTTYLHRKVGFNWWPLVITRIAWLASGIRSRYEFRVALVKKSESSRIPSSERVGDRALGSSSNRGFPNMVAVLLARTLDSLTQANLRHLGTSASLGSVDSLSLLGIGVRASFISQAANEVRPGHLISFLTRTNFASLVSHVPPTSRRIVCERNDIALQKIAPQDAMMRIILYPKADVITANLSHSVKALERIFRNNTVLYLPNLYQEVPAAKGNSTGKNVFMACRLEKQKNVETVIRAFAQAGLNSAGWQLRIYGDGSEKPRLRSLTAKLGLAAGVSFLKSSHEWHSEIRAGDFFVSASSFEGSSNALHEAVQRGAIPLVATSVREILDILSPRLIKALTFKPTNESLAGLFRRLGEDITRDHDLAKEVQQCFSLFWIDTHKIREKTLRIMGLGD